MSASDLSGYSITEQPAVLETSSTTWCVTRLRTQTGLGAYLTPQDAAAAAEADLAGEPARILAEAERAKTNVTNPGPNAHIEQPEAAPDGCLVGEEVDEPRLPPITPLDPSRWPRQEPAPPPSSSASTEAS